MGKQMAVEWLQEGLETVLSHEQQMQVIGLFEQAKEMHREQIEEAYVEGHESTYVSCDSGCGGNYCIDLTKDEYFNKTYGGENV
jgi:uncharacterized protein with von Willebrand factor type A (vWA) domain